MDVRRRILTRIAWLGVSQQEFARAIRMDKGSLSRAVRSGTRPRAVTLSRIADGLDLSVEELTSTDAGVLLRAHPAMRGTPGSPADQLASWFAAKYPEES